MKYNIFIYFIICVLLLIGCNSQNGLERDSSSMEENSNSVNIIEEGGEPNHSVPDYHTSVDNPAQLEYIAEPDVPAIVVSWQELRVPYEGDLLINSIVEYNGILYLGGKDNEENYFLHQMELEKSTSTLFVEIPDGMAIKKMTVDQEGKLHLFLSDDFTYGSIFEIWIINRSGVIEKRIDITEEWGQRIHTFAFTIDNEGNYYLRGMESSEATLVLSPEGEFLYNIPLQRGFGLYEALGRGKDGKVYAGVSDDERQIQVLWIDGVNGRAETISKSPMPDSGAMLDTIGAGTDTDFLLFGIGCGIISYDIKTDTAKVRVPLEEFPGDTERSSVSIFLSDGRMLFMEMVVLWEGDKFRQIAEGTIFYYIPAGE